VSDESGFRINKLPSYAQVSPINAGVAFGVNKDGNLDFISVGNNYAAEVETVMYDVGVGVVLLGDGKGDFTFVRPNE